MALTPRQREFLDKYVNRKINFLTKGGKTERSNNFAEIRGKLQAALLLAPPGLPELPTFIRAMRQADVLGEQLRFNRASQAMEKILTDLRNAKERYQPPKDPQGDPLVPGDEVEQLRNRLQKTLDDKRLNDPQVKLLANELEYPIEQSRKILDLKAVKRSEFDQAQGLVEEIEGKIDRISLHRERIEARRRKLEKYLKLAEERDDIKSDKGFVSLKEDVLNLLASKGWTSIQESSATALHLKLMLALAGGTGTRQHDFKKKHFEMVLGIRRKQPDLEEPNGRESNFKMIVKPAKFEIAVNGFKPGGGATREAMGSFLGDELQRQMGFDLNVPETRVVTMLGRDMMGDSLDKEQGIAPITGKKINKVFGEDEHVITSVQSYEQDCQSIAKLASKDQGEGSVGSVLDERVPKREIQQMAVFDLISLHMDRHADNMMLDKDNKLVPIDHGNIMPTKAGLRQRAAYIHSDSVLLAKSKAAMEPLSPELIERLEQLDIDQLVASMEDQHRQMKIENDGIDVVDLGEGTANVRRSSEFLKFAARELSLTQIYDAFSQLQDLIFFSAEEGKEAAFRKAVDTMKNRVQAQGMLELFLGVGPETENKEDVLRARVFERLRKLGWFLGGSEKRLTFNETFQKNYPERCLEILSTRQTSGLSESMEERYEQLGGRSAEVRLGYASDDRRVKMPKSQLATKVNGLELHYAITGRRPTA